jgi:hypothetical protein
MLDLHVVRSRALIGSHDLTLVRLRDLIDHARDNAIIAG